MNPYELDQQTYANSVAQYMRHAKNYDKQVNAYNAAATAYNDSFVKEGANQNPSGYINNRWTPGAPGPMTGVGLWANPDNGQLLMRRASGFTPTGQVATLSYGSYGRPMVNIPGVGSRSWEWGTPLLLAGYAAPVDPNNLSKTLGAKEYSPNLVIPAFNDGQQIALYRPTYVDKPSAAPAAFTEAKPTAPTGTIAQEAGRESAAHQMANSLRGGLVSDVLASRGVR